ncbi:hypothetical protein V8F06_004592 [Rhypophila decipiens]
MSLDIILNKNEVRKRSPSPMEWTPSTAPAPGGYRSVKFLDIRNILNNEPAQPRPAHPRIEPKPSPPSPATSTLVRTNTLSERAEKIPFHHVTASRPKRNKKRLQQGYETNERNDLNPTTGHRAKKRGAFSEAKRKETENTRRNKACFRCRNQQIRCEPDYHDPKGWCIPCKKVVLATSKKIIHKLPCFRVKITTAVLYRSSLRGGSLSGGDTVTPPKRFELPPLSSGRGKNGHRTINITFGIGKEPITLEVSEPKSRAGESPEKGSGEDGAAKLRKELPSFDLVDSKWTAEWIHAYIERHAFEQETLDLVLQDSHPLIQETYREALLHCQRLTASDESHKEKHEREKFMRDLIKFWFAMRHTIGSSWVCEKEASGIGTGTQTPASGVGKLLTPGPIAAQFHSLVSEHILNGQSGLRTAVLHQLEIMLARNKPADWYTVYLAVFILLHEISVTTKDQNDDSMARLCNARYSQPEFVQDLHHSANIIIVHWHYWRRNVNPLTIENHRASPLSHLSDSEFNFVVDSHKTMDSMSDDIEAMRKQDKWEHELFWISKMFGQWSGEAGFIASVVKRESDDLASMSPPATGRIKRESDDSASVSPPATGRTPL